MIVELNLFELKLPIKVKRTYYYNPQTEPRLFAKNLGRVNKLRFFHSSDLVWVETVMVDVKLVPKELDNYKRAEEVIENDEKLFVRTLYSYIGKLFKDNEFIATPKNLYVNAKTKTLFQSNPEVSYYEAYQVKIYKLQNKFYLSVNPRYFFLSSKPALESKIKTPYVFNIASGKSFLCRKCEENELVIQVDPHTQKRVDFPQNYYFNFSPSEAEKHGFSKELYSVYSNVSKLFDRLQIDVGFLNQVADLSELYQLPLDKVEPVLVVYRFKNGSSNDPRKIFELGALENPGRMRLTFIFPKYYKEKEIENEVKEVFANQDSVYYRSLRAMGFVNVTYVRNTKEQNKAKFFYDESFNIENVDDIAKAGRVFAVVLLEGETPNLPLLLSKLPRNAIAFPIIKEKVLAGPVYIIRSFAYKALNFTEDAKAYELIDLIKNVLFVGFDLSHDHVNRLSHFALSAVDDSAKILYIHHKENLPLNEKAELELLQNSIAQALNRYKLVHGSMPACLLLMRDGIFFEDISYIRNYLDTLGLKYIVVEVNKNSNINGPKDLKGKILELDEKKFVYFATTYNLQKAVEINVVLNNSNLTPRQIAKHVYLSTRLFHPTPYVNLKLPYPLYVTDKVSLLGQLWKLYVPYFKPKQHNDKNGSNEHM